MADKQAMIKELLAMQKMFIDYERKNGVEMRDYYAAEAGHPLENYREKYAELANKVLDAAHEEVGSKR